jgi:hypothetical protein
MIQLLEKCIWIIHGLLANKSLANKGGWSIIQQRSLIQ